MHVEHCSGLVLVAYALTIALPVQKLRIMKLFMLITEISRKQTSAKTLIRAVTLRKFSGKVSQHSANERRSSVERTPPEGDGSDVQFHEDVAHDDDHGHSGPFVDRDPNEEEDVLEMIAMNEIENINIPLRSDSSTHLRSDSSTPIRSRDRGIPLFNQGTPLENRQMPINSL